MPKAIVLSVQAVFALALLGTSWHLLDSSQQSVREAHDNRYASYLLADELRQSSDDLTRLARTYVVTADARYEDQYMAVLDIRNGKKPRPQDYSRIYWDFVAATDAKPRPDGRTVPLQELMTQSGFTQEEFGKLRQAQANSDGLVKLEVIAMNAVKGLFDDGRGNFTVKKEPDLELARKLLHSREYHAFKADIMRPIDEFFVLLDRRTTQAVTDAQAQARNYAILMVVALALVAAAMALLIALLFAGVLNPIGRLAGAMARLAKQDPGVEIPARSQRDEIGAMTDAVRVFKENADDIRRLTEEQEGAKIRAAAEQKAAMNRLADGFERSVKAVVESVSTSATDLRGAAATMTAAADSTSQRTATAAMAVEQTAGNVNSVASASEQLSASISEIGRQVDQSSEIAGRAVVQAKKTSGSVSGLSEAAQKIGDVVRIIESIASQTNLLALNATIEAARAGDAGKGFAVVASEVKTLANQTASATQEIQTQVTQIQAATTETVAEIGAIGDIINQMSEFSASISAAVDEQRAATAEIARNIQQASTGSNEVASAVAVVSSVAAEAGTAAGQVMSAATRLSDQSQSLRREVDGFVASVRTA